MSHKITLLPSHHTFFQQINKPILDNALLADIAFPYGCRRGVCGACKGKVITGTYHYEDDNLPKGLNKEEHAQGFALFCQCYANTDLTIEINENDIANLNVKTLPARIHTLNRLNHDVMEIILKCPAIEQMQFYAGQYLDILLPDNKKRSFSIANAPYDNQFIHLHIRHVPDGLFTSKVFNEFKVKTMLRIKLPLGTFHLHQNNPKPMLLIAGGTGFAPIKSIIEQANYLKLNRKMHLFWGTRKRVDIYSELPKQWLTHPLFNYTHVLSEKDEDWRGEQGFVHNAIAKHYPDLTPYQAYLCGPPAMIEATQNTLTKLGLNEKNRYSDSFTYEIN